MAVSAQVVSYTTSLFREITAKPATSAGENTLVKDSHNTGNFIPYSSRIVCELLASHRELMNIEDICETGPTVCTPYARRLGMSNHLRV